MTTIDEYLEGNATPTQRAELERVRKIIKQHVPEAEETISYGIPTFKYKGTYLVYLAAYKKHMSLFGGLTDIEDKLGDFKLSHKGTLQFTEDNPVPEAILIEIIDNRLRAIADGKNDMYA